MKYEYYTCDVFTRTRFGGNPLAVVPQANGLSDQQMQHIAREFNYSETTFVLPAEAGHTRRVRIFTPFEELPFAGHPNIGTAYVLASIGALGKFDGRTTIEFEERAGIVAIDIEARGGVVDSCELRAPQALSLGAEAAPADVAVALSLQEHDIVVERHQPRMASVGLAFLMVELRDRRALERARVNPAGFETLAAKGLRPHVHIYTRSGDEFDVRARMFAPTTGVPEDPATGSANCALAGLLAQLSPVATEDCTLTIAQGVEMGRPSMLLARTSKRGGVVTDVWIGGGSVMVAEGTIEV